MDEHLVDVEEESYNARDEESFVDAQETPPDLPDSPWTIEAIDGEQDEEDVCTLKHAASAPRY